MKRMVIVLLIAMLATPMVLAAPNGLSPPSNPNAPAALQSNVIVDNEIYGILNEPGFSEIGVLESMRAIEGWPTVELGVTAFAPGEPFGPWVPPE